MEGLINANNSGVDNGHGTQFDFLSFDSSEFENRSWVDIIDEEERRKEEEEAIALRERELEQSIVKQEAEVVSSLESNDSMPNRRSIYLPNPKEEWPEPRMGWCKDEQIVLRREKQLRTMKERPTYKRYLSQIPKFARKKGVHPKTPNKFLNFSRRSWDQQVKRWKLDIYNWAGETPTPSVAASSCSSECSDEDIENRSTMSSPGPSMRKRVKLEKHLENEESKKGDELCIQDVNIVIANPDNMASMLGQFDFDTLRGEPTLITADESTLKAVPTSTTAHVKEYSKGPITRAKSYAEAVQHQFENSLSNNVCFVSGPGSDLLSSSYADVVRRRQLAPVKGPTDFSHMMPVKDGEKKPEGNQKMRKILTARKKGKETKKGVDGVNK